ncbi:outer membrane lipoprotein-sorting protein [Shewanella abyssi]|uniref:outer membrane lipoprotein-sorting protein n=1 Tax=Shewanella abyssi TaxID=311789 RepID=UPI00200DB004|nr:outer membrane lipoprotein-sorting protein [Shewanella abyssi]MCL1051027.1 outer membrane lipoprotein-sorting protein [Shewanella abyssi]
MKKYNTTLAGMICGYSLCFAAVSQANTDTEQKGYAIASVVEQRDQGFTDSRAMLTMELYSKSGAKTTRKLDISVLENEIDGDKSLIKFTFPADINGTALLTHPAKSASDEQWLYLPEVSRVKRIGSRNKAGAFVGSEFSFEDMTNKDLEDYSYNYLFSQPCELIAASAAEFAGKQCDVIERFPVDKHSGYSKQELWIDNQDSKIIQIKYFDRKKSLLKVFSASGFKLYQDKYWRPDLVQMKNVQTGKATILSYQNIIFASGLTEQDFHRSALGD